MASCFAFVPTFRQALLRPNPLTFVFTTAFVMVVYLYTLAPNLTLGFAGIFSTGAMYGGVPGPPGYPAWTVYGWAFVKLFPFSNVAWRLGVASALAASMACGLVATMVADLGRLVSPENEGPSHSHSKLWTRSNAIRIWAGFLAGSSVGFDGGLWREAVVAGPWPLSVFLFALVLFCLSRWLINAKRKRYLYLAIWLYALAATNSQALLAAGFGLQLLVAFGNARIGRDLLFANVLTIPLMIGLELKGLFPWQRPGAAALFQLCNYLWVGSAIACIGLAVRERGILTEWKVMLFAGFLFVAGSAAYFYVPIASMANPPVNWGYPRTVTGFFHILTRGQYEAIQLPEDLMKFAGQIGIYLRVMAKEFGILQILLAICPSFFWKKLSLPMRRWLLGSLAANLGFVLVLIAILNPRSNRGSIELCKVFYSASHLLPAVSAGLAMILLLQRTVDCPAESEGLASAGSPKAI